jgi:hypothetical protein
METIMMQGEKCEKEELKMKEEAHRQRCNETWRYEST